MLRVSGSPHFSVGTQGIRIELVTGEYQQEILGDHAFDSTQVTNILLCTSQEAAALLRNLDEQNEQGVALVPVPTSAKEYLAVYEFFNTFMASDSALGGEKKALELVEIWARGCHGPTDGGRIASEATGPASSER